MKLRSTIRLLALIAAACTVGIVVFKPFKRLAYQQTNLTLAACENAWGTETEAEVCGEALAVLDKVISGYDNADQTPVLLRDRAWVKYVLDDLEGSLSDINWALKLAPHSAWSWYWRGRLNMLSGDVRTAIADYRRSLDVDPVYCRTNRVISDITHVMYKIGRNGDSALGEIIKTRRHAGQHDPYLAFVNHLANFSEGPYRGAQNVLDQLIGSTDRPEHLLLLRARVSVQMGLHEEAMVDLDLLTAGSDFYEQVGEQLRAQIHELRAAGNSCAADVFSTRNAQFTFDYRDALRLKIQLQMDSENWTHALATLDVLNGTRTYTHTHWTQRGEVLEKLGREEEALASYLEAIRIARPENWNAKRGSSPALLQALFGVASIHNTQDRSADALVVWDESLSIAHKSVIEYAQKMMEIAGHYEGEQTKTYDEETKTAVRSCLADAKCNWARLYPQMLRK